MRKCIRLSVLCLVTLGAWGFGREWRPPLTPGMVGAGLVVMGILAVAVLWVGVAALWSRGLADIAGAYAACKTASYVVKSAPPKQG